MTFITARDLRLKPAEVWEKLQQEGNVVVTVNGRPCAIITGVTPESLDESLKLLKKVKAEAALSRLRDQSAKAGSNRLSLPTINKEISAARKARS